MTRPCDWLGPAGDLLKEHSLDQAATALEVGLQAVAMLEEQVAARLDVPGGWGSSARVSRDFAALIALIARAWGETPEEVVDRLSPDPEPRQLNRTIRRDGNQRSMFPAPVLLAAGPEGDLPAGTVVVRGDDGRYWSYTPDPPTEPRVTE